MLNYGKKYGTGPTDNSTEKMRRKVGDIVLSADISLFYNLIKKYADRVNKESLSYEEIEKIRITKFFNNIMK